MGFRHTNGICGEPHHVHDETCMPVTTEPEQVQEQVLVNENESKDIVDEVEENKKTPSKKSDSTKKPKTK